MIRQRLLVLFFFYIFKLRALLNLNVGKAFFVHVPIVLDFHMIPSVTSLLLSPRTCRNLNVLWINQHRFLNMSIINPTRIVRRFLSSSARSRPCLLLHEQEDDEYYMALSDAHGFERLFINDHVLFGRSIPSFRSPTSPEMSAFTRLDGFNRHFHVV